MTILKAGPGQIDLSRPVCMGIINSTPDSFSDGNGFNKPNQNQTTEAFSPDLPSIVSAVADMVEQGISIVDVGGESTRPGAQSVSEAQELERVIPVIEAIHSRFDVCISIDTSTPEVMRQALSAGARMINDVRALSRPGALGVAADSDAAICLMHMQGQPSNMQANAHYDDIVAEVLEFLRSRIIACVMAGIDSSRLCIDPGFGFGKSVEHNYSLLKHLARFHELEVPLLVGLSRKSMIGHATGREINQRLSGSVAATMPALAAGAKIVRTHDVAATIDAIGVHCAYQNAD